MCLGVRNQNQLAKPGQTLPISFLKQFNFISYLDNEIFMLQFLTPVVTYTIFNVSKARKYS